MTEKIYLQNPYLRDITAKVLKKEYINGKFHVVLNRTIFYPHLSGGQPKDKGTINGVSVLDVYEEGNEIIHVLEDNIDENVRLSIDWNTRFDHMQQHTGQHILSAAFYNLYGAETIGFHLGTEYVYIDVTLPCLSDNDIERIERYSNEIIFSNFNIEKYIIDKNSISKLPLRKFPSVESNIRIVEISGIDYSPCSGTHHRTTGEVGIIKIRKWEKYKENIRVEFVCGNRALRDFSWKNDYINKISNLLSVKDKNCLDSVLKLYEQNKSLEKQIRSLNEEVSKYRSFELINNAIIYNNTKIIKKLFFENNLSEVRTLVNNILKFDNTIILFGLVEKGKCQIILGRSNNLDINMLDIFNSVITIIEGRGGGNPQLAQGGGSKTDKIEECIENALNIIKKSSIKIEDSLG